MQAWQAAQPITDSVAM